METLVRIKQDGVPVARTRGVAYLSWLEPGNAHMANDLSIGEPIQTKL